MYFHKLTNICFNLGRVNTIRHECGLLVACIFIWNNAEEQANGTHASTVRAHCAAASEAAAQCQPPEPAGSHAILCVAGHGCRRRGLPERFGNWHTVCTRMNRWSKNGVLDRVFGHLQREQMIRIRVEVLSLDSTSIGCIPTARVLRKKRPAVHRQVPGRGTARLHLAAADA